MAENPGGLLHYTTQEGGYFKPRRKTYNLEHILNILYPAAAL